MKANKIIKKKKQKMFYFSSVTGKQLSNNTENAIEIEEKDLEVLTCYCVEISNRILKTHIIKNGYVYGIYDILDDKPIYGCFKNDTYTVINCLVKDPQGMHKISSHSCKFVKIINSNIANKLYTNFNGVVYYDIFAEKDLIDKLGNYFGSSELLSGSNTIKNNLGFKYSLSDHNKSVISFLTNNMDSTESLINNDFLENFLKSYTYGVEIETNDGTMPLHTLVNNGFLPLRDGSIGGDEFTSVPMKGLKNISNIYNFTKVAKVNCGIDLFCSLHLHVGNHNFTKKELVAFYMLMYQIQNEIFDFVPPYKRSEKYFAKKNEVKDHCKPIKSLGLYNPIKPVDITNAFIQIEHFVLPEKMQMDNGKWNEFSRYFFVNLLPYFKRLRNHGDNNGTIEFRIHEPTLSFEKIFIWIIMNISFIEYTKKYTDEIINRKKLTIYDIIVSIITDEKLKTIILDYIISRVEAFNEIFISGDYINTNYLKNDRLYKNPELLKYLNIEQG